MKKIYFRILAICLSLFLTFSLLYKDSIQAEALEWVGVAVGYDTAFKFLLGLLGVSVGVGVAEEVDWGQLRQDCTQVMIDQGASQVEASQWWSDVIHGSLDTASSCWTSFKDWIKNDLLSSSSSVSFDINLLLREVFPNLKTVNPQSITNNNYVYGYYAVNSADPSTIIILYLFKDDYSLSTDIVNGEKYFTFTAGSSSSYFNKTTSSYGTSAESISFNYKTGSTSAYNNAYDFYFFGCDETVINEVSNYHTWGESLVLPDESDFTSSYSDIDDIALNPENADTLGVDVIPLPWENIGVSEDAIQDIIDDAIERVIDGTMSLENYWEYVQNITNTYAYSIENNYLLPNENGEDKKADDKVKENTENGAFVLYGLEKVFPFCIPFDIYAFITLLKADPVAPVIEYPIYNPVTQENEIITIDFSEWESVVIIFRYIFDFLLIIGLLLLARPLVGAGGDS